jgi:SAM-dependent methyltransferase
MIVSADNSAVTVPSSDGQPLPLASEGGQPTRRVLVAVSILTACMLIFEILQTITLALQIFAQNAFLVVSVAMLGLGSGGSIATYLLARKRLPSPIGAFWFCAMGFSLSIVLLGLVTSRTPRLEWLMLGSVVPYVFIGVLLSLLFSTWSESVGRSYFADLLGSASGCLVLIFLINLTGSAGQVTLLIAAAGFTAAGLFALGWYRRRLVTALALALVTLVLLPLDGVLYPYTPAPNKHYGRMLADPLVTSTLESSRWDYLGRLDVVRPGAGIERVQYGEEARRIIDRGGDYRFLYASGDNWSYAIKFADAAHQAEYVRTAVPSAPYRVVAPQPDVLVIGVGGGVDLFLATAHGARSVEAVDISPLMIRAARGLGSDWWAGALQDPRIRYVEMDGRTFAETTQARYDVVTLTAVDTGAAVAGGGLVLTENYLYTVEGFESYLSVLKPGGAVFVLRPVPDLEKVTVTATEALRRRGVSAPEQHFAVLGDGEWRGMLIFRDPIDNQTIATIEGALRDGLAGGAIDYLPGRAPTVHEFVPIFASMQRGQLQSFVDANPHARLTFDNWPFFYHRNATLWGSPAGDVLAEILFLVALGGMLLIGLPVVGLRVAQPRRTRFTVLVYFAAIGLGFMFAEMALMQRLALLLGHPVYSVTVTLFVLLLATGVGSWASARWDGQESVALRRALLAVAALLAMLAWGLPELLQWAAVPSFAARIAFASLLVAGLGLLLGMAFPLRVRLLSRSAPSLIPWAWAVNGVASVLGAALSLVIAMESGFTLVLALASVCYVCASLSLGWSRATARAEYGSRVTTVASPSAPR